MGKIINKSISLLVAGVIAVNGQFQYVQAQEYTQNLLDIPVQVEQIQQTTESALQVSGNNSESILQNCSVVLQKEGCFEISDQDVTVQVTLDDSLNEVYLTLYAYPGNVTFDPDSSANIRLYGGFVSNGDEVSCAFNPSMLPLKKGWKVIGCLNVPVGNDNYRPVNSLPIEVVDDNGEGAPNYIWPDVSIVESALEEGTTRAHLKMTGDERIFQNPKVDVHYCVYQYPEDEAFDFESDKMIGLFSSKTKEAFENKEVSFSEPLRSGYRVRAVAYWTQDYESFIPKSNDYEFGQPDDSVLIRDQVQAVGVEIGTKDIKAGATGIKVDLEGDIPAGSILIVHSYPKGESFELGKNSKLIAMSQNIVAEAGKILDVPMANRKYLSVDRQVIALVMNQGASIATSKVVPVVSAENLEPFQLEIVDKVREGDEHVVLKVKYDPSILQGRLLLHMDDAASMTVNLEETIANVDLVQGEAVSITVPKECLQQNKKIAASIYYCKPGTEDHYLYYTTEQSVILPRATQAQIAIVNPQFNQTDTSATLNIEGCETFLEGQLIIAQYPENMGVFDPDNHLVKRLYQGTFHKQGRHNYTFTQNTPLLPEHKVIAYLYKYDASADTISTHFSDSVDIVSDPQESVAPKVEITTSIVQEDTKNIWVINQFDEKNYSGRLDVYAFDEEVFDEASETNRCLYQGVVTSSEASKKIEFNPQEIPLRAGQKLVAMLTLYPKNGEDAVVKSQSNQVVVQRAPEVVVPVMTINEKEVTQGDTKVKVSVSYDDNIEQAQYTLYMYEGEQLEINSSTTKILSEGKASRNWRQFPINLSGAHRPLQVGAKLVGVLTVTDKMNEQSTYYSNVVQITSRPDWAVPMIGMEIFEIKETATQVPVRLQYDEGYHGLDEFYCNVTLYQYPGHINDFDAEGLYAEVVGSINGTKEEPINNQSLQVALKKPLKEGYKLIAKLRLPHVEWEGEEVDYLSDPVNIIGKNIAACEPAVLLYNLGSDTSRGSRLRKILEKLEIQVKEIEKTQLNEKIGHLVGLEGYDSVNDPYLGEGYESEFMLMSGLGQVKLDAFLQAMMDEGLRINHKAIVTQFNREWTLKRLIGDIEEEHDIFTALIALDKLIYEAEQLKMEDYDVDKWSVFQDKLYKANEILSSVEPSLESLLQATDELSAAILSMCEKIQLTGEIILQCIAEGENYTVSAKVENAPVDATYTYTWSNGETGAYVEQISQEALKKISVTVAGTGKFWGTLPKAQLQVPCVLQDVKAQVKDGGIHLSWTVGSNPVNTPEVIGYEVEVFAGGQEVRKLAIDPSDRQVYVGNLKNGVVYTFKMCATNVIGTSDKVILTAIPEDSGESGSGESGSGESDSESTESEENSLGKDKESISEEVAFLEIPEQIEKHWAKTSITFALQHQLFGDVTVETFSPETLMTRGEFLMMLNKLETLEKEGIVGETLSEIKVLDWAGHKGIMQGNEKGDYETEAFITREQLITMLYRYSSVGTSVQLSLEDKLSRFKDADTISDYAKEAMVWATEKEIIKGSQQGQLNPKGSANNAEVATIIERFYMMQ